MTTSAPPVAPPQKQPANDEKKDGEDDGFDDFGDFGDFSAAPSSQPKAEEKKETAGASNPLDDIFGTQMVTLEDEDQDDDDFGDLVILMTLSSLTSSPNPKVNSMLSLTCSTLTLYNNNLLSTSSQIGAGQIIILRKTSQVRLTYFLSRNLL